RRIGRAVGKEAREHPVVDCPARGGAADENTAVVEDGDRAGAFDRAIGYVETDVPVDAKGIVGRAVGEVAVHFKVGPPADSDDAPVGLDGDPGVGAGTGVDEHAAVAEGGIGDADAEAARRVSAVLVAGGGGDRIV